jgi:hypothetical protein
VGAVGGMLTSEAFLWWRWGVWLGEWEGLALPLLPQPSFSRIGLFLFLF